MNNQGDIPTTADIVIKISGEIVHLRNTVTPGMGIRIISILLLGLLLYNMMGLSVAYLMEDRHYLAEAPESVVERNLYSNDIMIKVPVSVPYQINWEHPEQAEGSILHHGEHYQMRTRQLINDTLYIHCEIDQGARDRFANLVSRIQDELTAEQHSKKPASVLLKHFLKEFVERGRRHIFFLLEWVPAYRLATAPFHFAVASHIGSIPSPPPDQL